MIAGGRLYVRNSVEMVCLRLPQKQAQAKNRHEFFHGTSAASILSEIDFCSSAPTDLTDVVGLTSHLDFAQSSKLCYVMISSAIVVTLESQAERVRYWADVRFL